MEFSRLEYWSGLLFPTPKESSRPRDQTQVSHTAGSLSSEPASSNSKDRVSDYYFQS